MYFNVYSSNIKITNLTNYIIQFWIPKKMVIFPVEANLIRAMDIVVLKWKYFIPTPFVQVGFFNWSGVVDYTVATQIYYMLSLNGNLPLCIFNHKILSIIDGFIIYLFQMNQYYQIMQNIRDAIMHLMKNLYWLLSHLLFICFCYV